MFSSAISTVCGALTPLTFLFLPVLHDDNEDDIACDKLGGQPSAQWRVHGKEGHDHVVIKQKASTLTRAEISPRLPSAPSW